MEITQIRNTFTDKTTISTLSIDGLFECYVLEDVCRTGGKVHGKTAIPDGRYEIVVTFSNRFQKPLPLLLRVPGFEGIRIHPGNRAEDTEGCLLPGRLKALDFVGESRAAFNSLFAKIKAVSDKEKVFITISKG